MEKDNLRSLSCICEHTLVSGSEAETHHFSSLTKRQHLLSKWVRANVTITPQSLVRRLFVA